MVGLQGGLTGHRPEKEEVYGGRFGFKGGGVQKGTRYKLGRKFGKEMTYMGG